MPIQLPTLDDRTYADLVAELRGLIPSYAPDWTDHNPSDPGITFLELFAWLAEGLIYRVDRVPEDSIVRMLELLGATFQPAHPATVMLQACLTSTGEGADTGLTLPAGTALMAQPPGQTGTLPFETVDELQLIPAWPAALVAVRQVARMKEAEFLGRSNGQPRQTFRLAQTAIFVDPTGAPPCVPEVTVNGEAWAYRADLLNSGPNDRHFTVDARRNAIRFGTGKDRSAGTAGNGVPRPPGEGGAIPPKDAAIRATYCHTLGAGGNTPDGTQYAPMRTGLALDLVPVGPAAGGSDPTSLDDARAEAYGIINNPWRAITDQDFEQLVLGRPGLGLARAETLPEVDASRLGGRPRVPSGGQLAQPVATASLPANEAALERRPGHVSVMVYPEPARDPLALMKFPSALRAVTFSRDGQTLAAWAEPVEAGPGAANGCGAPTPDQPRGKGSRMSTERVYPVWLWRAGGWPVGLYLPPGIRPSCMALSPDGHWVALGAESQVQSLGSQVIVWDVQRFVRVELQLPGAGGQPLGAQAGAPVTQIAFRPDAAQMIVLSGTTAERWNREQELVRDPLRGTLVRQPPWVRADTLPHPAPVQEAMFSADGRQLATLAADNAIRLWGSAPGELLAALSHAEPVRQILFSSDGRRLATLSGAKTVLAWARQDTEDRRGQSWAPLPAPDVPLNRVTAIALRQGGQRLIVVGETPRRGQAVAFCNLDTGEVDSSRPLPRGSIANALSSDARWLLMADQNDPLHPQLWAVDAGRRAGVLHHDEPVRRAFFGLSGDRVATIALGEGPVVRTWDAADGALEMRLDLPQQGAIDRAQDLSAALSPDGKFLVTWQPNGPATLRVWETGRLLRTSEYLAERRLVTTRSHVVGTQFVDLQVRAAVVPKPRTDAGRLIEAIRASLQAFFAPLRPDATQTGQEQTEGWPYGRHVYLSEVYQVIEGVAGVDHVESLNLYTRSEYEGADVAAGADLEPWHDSGAEVVVPPNQLVHYVRLRMQDEPAGATGDLQDISVRRTG